MSKTKVRKVEGHQCSLPQEEDLISLYINDGIFVNLRRKFRRCMMVDPGNVETKSILRSSAQIRWEEARHLRNFYHIIHPFSRARVMWETIMIVVYASLYVLMPIQIALNVTPPIVKYGTVMCSVFSYIDVILFFCTGYYDSHYRRIVMSRKKICKNYVFSFFVFDVVGSFPYDLCTVHLENQGWFGVKYAMILRLVRLPTFINYVRRFFTRLNMWNYKLKITSLFVWIFILIWWSTSMVYRIFVVTDGSIQQQIFAPMLESCFQIVRIFTLVDNSSLHVDTVGTHVFYLSMLFGGCILNLVIFAQVMQLYKRSSSSSRDRYNNLIQEISHYMNYKELPTPTKRKIFCYMDFKYQKNIFKEGDIMNTLSKSLKQDILIHTCDRLVKGVDFFKGLPNHIILQIIRKLRSEIYLPNDVIVKAGVYGNCMYFIFIGTVAVFSPSNTEICHLEDGDHFGEITLILSEPRVASIVAVTNCELFRLNRRDFQEAILAYPTFHEKIKSSAIARLYRNQKEKLARQQNQG